MSGNFCNWFINLVPVKQKWWRTESHVLKEKRCMFQKYKNIIIELKIVEIVSNYFSDIILFLGKGD